MFMEDCIRVSLVLEELRVQISDPLSQMRHLLYRLIRDALLHIRASIIPPANQETETVSGGTLIANSSAGSLSQKQS